MSGAAVSVVDLLPAVTDDDIREAERLLGVRFDDSRREILRSNDTFDVQACPGSGKTTLLVAKLAILGSKWRHTRRGMCVLSHTNVARQEIEKKLAVTAAGQQLLAYPHFVGTIHRFVNEFLALPLLRSEGGKVHLIDDEACGDYCRRVLYSVPAYATAKNFLTRCDAGSPDRTICALRYERKELALKCAAGRLACGPSSPSFADLAAIKQRACDAGLWRFDDMFAWAERLLDQHPRVIEFVSWRFPAVFIDEMQDTSEIQGRLLAAVFPRSAGGVRQRFGDSNQAIYDFGHEAARTDAFPAAGACVVPNSQRFGPGIPAKAAQVAPNPPQPPMVGEGPRTNLLPVDVDHTAMPHTVFLFKSGAATQVFPRFASLLLKTFPDPVLRSDVFVARAIGRVGKPGGNEDRIPNHLGDYWPDYEPRAAKLEARPQTLAGYVHLAQRRRASSVDCAEAVKAVTKGLAQLVEYLAPGGAPDSGQSIRGLLAGGTNDEAAVRVLRDVLWSWCVAPEVVAQGGWNDQVARLRRAISPIVGDRWNPGAERFCAWSVEFSGPSIDEGSQRCTTPNRYHFVAGERFVEIDVGTIHGAKGQTHSATLVVETFSWGHDLGDLMPWLTGVRAGALAREGTRRLERMRLIYTAMTRPTHLLCLGMRLAAVGAGAKAGENIERLRSLGWEIEIL